MTNLKVILERANAEERPFKFGGDGLYFRKEFVCSYSHSEELDETEVVNMLNYAYQLGLDDGERKSQTKEK